MSERMTNERLNDLARAGNAIACAQEADRARVAEQTLLRAVQAKDATIKALADVLWSYRHLLQVHVPGTGNVLPADVAAALRLAGRL